MTPINLYITGIFLMFFSGLPSLPAGKGSRSGARLSALLLVAGSLAGLAASVAAVFTPLPSSLDSALLMIPGGRLVLRLDGLALIFLIPAFLISGLGAIYSNGYWPSDKYPDSSGNLRLWYGALTASIALIPVSGNGLLFLVAWEIMAIAGFALILTEQKKTEVRRAAFVYICATHAGTLCLYAMFILLANQSGSFDFPAAASLDGTSMTAAFIFVLALLGFGVKAGIMPLHIWLPGAHAAAPSHVSALMSGIMIKMGIYGLVRITGFFSAVPPWWGWTVLILGAFSGVLGVAFAIAQHDIKRLLAYHSVENIGIILLGLGTALLGRSVNQPGITALGLAGCLLHVINHALFKSLLFFSAGSLINATGTRMIDHYGGLLRRMPATAVFFLGGAAAICGLPPLNGFVSEWLVYLGLLHSQTSGSSAQIPLLVTAVPVLALIGALAAACFVKVFGIAFLGEERRNPANTPVESPLSMTAPMGVILACCAAIGIAPRATAPLLEKGIAGWAPAAPMPALPATLAPLGWISIGALLLTGLLLLTLFLQHSKRGARGNIPTWGCGYLHPTSRMQYTSSSFAEMLLALFRWSLWTEIRGGPAQGLFPAPLRFSDHTPDAVLDRMIVPFFKGAARAAYVIRSFLQHGVLGIYLLYPALAVIVLLSILD